MDRKFTNYRGEVVDLPFGFRGNEMGTRPLKAADSKFVRLAITTPAVGSRIDTLLWFDNRSKSTLRTLTESFIALQKLSVKIYGLRTADMIENLNGAINTLDRSRNLPDPS